MIFEVVVRDRKNVYIYSFSLKAKSLNRALFLIDRFKENFYEAASDVGIVNFASNFLEDNPKIDILAHKSKVQKADVILGNKEFLLKNNKLRAV